MARRPLLLVLLAIGLAAGTSSCAKPRPAKPLVGMAVQGARSGFTAAFLAAVEKRAEGRADLVVMDGGGDRNAQLAQVDKLIGMKARALVVAPSRAADAAGIIAAAKAKNVPLILIGSEPRIEDLRSWDKVFFVGDESSRAGSLQGEILAESWKTRPAVDRNGDDRMQVAFVDSGPDPDAKSRREACLAALERSGIQTDAAGEAEGWAAIAAFFADSGGRIEAVAAGDDESAAWAADALEAAGYSKGKNRVPVASLSLAQASPPRDEIEKGRFAGTVMGDAQALGAATLDLAYALAFDRDPGQAGFEIVEGKRVAVPYAKILASELHVSR